MKLPDVPHSHAFIALRAFTGIIFITHGAARLYYGTVDDFGEFLNLQGFLIGLPLAWTITIGEIVSGSCLVAGIKTRICVIFHGVIIITGIFLIHLPQGWFTVGQNSGGVEYSLLLLAVLIFIYSYSNDKK
jgi:putative oxidoreductase